MAEMDIVTVCTKRLSTLDPMADPFSITVSVLALGISSLTAWLTLLRRGTVKMTQPTVIFFGPDTPRQHDEPASPKVFLRTLLFSTGKRGRVIESMHVALSHDETHQNFNVWVYGDDKLVRGSGLFIGETGLAANHHFLAPTNENPFRFTEGLYRLEVFAHLLGDKGQILLFTQTLAISREVGASLKEPGMGLYFDWGPDSSRYLPHVEQRPPSPDPQKFLELLGLK
jgi:hypothetical protein